MIFHISSEDQIKTGQVTDVYFARVVEVLKEKGLDRWVKGEVRATTLPDNWDWAVLAGVEEVARLFEGLQVNVEALPEGTLFGPEIPVMTVEGKYTDFAVYETAFLGLVCQASGVATKAARCKIAADGRPVYSFGARRMHPAIAPMIERSAFIGGCDGVSVLVSAELIGGNPIGTMSHSLILTVGDEEEAFRAFDKVMEERVPRVALVDTFSDEKFGVLKAVEALGDRLFAVRLDTPRSRRGDFVKIMQEVRWELDLRGRQDVKIFASGGLDEDQIRRCNAYVDAYGVGTAISNAPVVDFSFDLVEVEGKPRAKRGKMSGSKHVLRCASCLETIVLPVGADQTACNCGERCESLTKALVERGKISAPLPEPNQIQTYCLDQLSKLRKESEPV